MDMLESKFRGGKILNPEPLFYDEKKSADIVIDCHGSLIAPGQFQ